MSKKPKKGTAPPAVPPKMGDLRIVRVKLSEIKAAPYNPRHPMQPGTREYQDIVRSLQTFGYASGLTYNVQTHHIVGGAQRFRVLCAEFDIQELDMVAVDLPLEQERRLNLALNKLGSDTARWDNSKLAELLEEIQKDGQGDASITGFTQDEIDAALRTANDTVTIAPIDKATPPQIAWALICVPLVQYGKIAGRIDELSKMDGVTVETITSNVK